MLPPGSWWGVACVGSKLLVDRSGKVNLHYVCADYLSVQVACVTMHGKVNAHCLHANYLWCRVCVAAAACERSLAFANENVESLSGEL